MERRPLPSEQRLGFKTRPIVNPVTNIVGVTATKILNNNPDRILFMVVNLSNVDGYLGFDREVSATRGFRIPSNGGSLTALIEEDGELVLQEVFAISPLGAGTWYIIEVVRM